MRNWSGAVELIRGGEFRGGDGKNKEKCQKVPQCGLVILPI